MTPNVPQDNTFQSPSPWHISRVRRVVVGSRNPVKVAAVAAILGRIAPGATVEGVSVASAVPAQPWGDAQTIRGARHRARAALVAGPATSAVRASLQEAASKGAATAGDLSTTAYADLAYADLGVGIEGGVVDLGEDGIRTCAWVVAVAPDGRDGVGGSLAMPLPPGVVERLRAGEELGHAMDAEAQVTGTKHGRGAVGILTAELYTRQAAYEPLVAYALAPFLAEPFFQPGGRPPGPGERSATRTR